MKDYPIIFSGDSIQAILYGRKTQTRRVLNPQPMCYGEDVVREWRRGELVGPEWYAPAVEGRDGEIEPGKDVFGIYDIYGEGGWSCPYVPGRRLWVRETTRKTALNDLAVYAADNDAVVKDGGWAEWWYSRDVCPPIFMPKWASRISLLVTAVRVERLHQMSFSDWIADLYPTDEEIEQARATFTGSAFQREHVQKKWNAINAKRGFRFEDDPWLFVVEFERVRNED